jgi:hypothetical protein
MLDRFYRRSCIQLGCASRLVSGSRHRELVRVPSPLRGRRRLDAGIRQHLRPSGKHTDSSSARQSDTRQYLRTSWTTSTQASNPPLCSSASGHARYLLDYLRRPSRSSPTRDISTDTPPPSSWVWDSRLPSSLACSSPLISITDPAAGRALLVAVGLASGSGWELLQITGYFLAASHSGSIPRTACT